MEGRAASPSPFPPSPLSLTVPPVPRPKKLSLRTALWADPSGPDKDYTASLYSQLLPCLAVHLGALSLGLGAAYPSLLHHTQPWDPAPWTAALHLLGAALGGLLSALLPVQLGRRGLLLAATLPDVASWLAAAAAPLLAPAAGPAMLLTSRVLAGAAAAIYLVGGQTYVAEAVQAEHRGWLAGLALPTAAIGVLAMYVLGSWLAPGRAALACLAPPLLLALALRLLPDTPHSLLLRGREKEAQSALERLRGGAVGPEMVGLQAAVQQLEGGLLHRFRLLFTQKKYSSPFFILNFLILIIAFSGVSTMNLYANELFQRAAGETSLYLSNIIIGLIQLGGCCLFLPLVRLYSRKQLVAGSSLAMAVSLGLLGLYLFSQTRPEPFFQAVGGAHWLAVLSFSAFLLAGPTGLCSVPLLYTAELFPTELRSLLAGLTMSLASLSLLLARSLAPAIAALLPPHGVVWLAASACLVALLFTVSTIPETRHAALGQIPGKLAAWRKEARASPWVTPVPSPSHSRAATPVRELGKMDFKTQMFTK